MPVWYGYGLDAYGNSPYGSVYPSAYITKTEAYELLYGYEAKWEQPDRSYRFPLVYDVVITSNSDNEARKVTDASVYYKFVTRGLIKSDLRALLQVDPGTQVSDLLCTLIVNSPHYEWGKEMTLVFEASDRAGNKLGPISIVYMLANKPD